MFSHSENGLLCCGKFFRLGFGSVWKYSHHSFVNFSPYNLFANLLAKKYKSIFTAYVVEGCCFSTPLLDFSVETQIELFNELILDVELRNLKISFCGLWSFCCWSDK